VSINQDECQTSQGQPFSIRKTVIFLALTFVFDWTLAFFYFASGRTAENSLFFPMATLYMITPAIMSVVVQKFIFKEPLIAPLAINFRPNRWFVIAWFLPFVMAFLAVIFALLFPGVHFSAPAEAVAIQVLRSITYGTAITTIFAFGEELGWRGLLWRELGHLGFWRASAVIGLIWGIWHAPLILAGLDYPQHPKLGFLLFLVNSMLLSNIFSYLRLKAKSVIAPSIAHGACNATEPLFSIGTTGGNDLLTGGCGLSTIAVYALFSIIIAVTQKKERHTD
jgi:uncharacterized protein